jgi:hypothetical protein
MLFRPASQVILAYEGVHTGDGAGSLSTTHPFAAPDAHDGPPVDQYRSANASFCVENCWPPVFTLHNDTHRRGAVVTQ